MSDTVIENAQKATSLDQSDGSSVHYHGDVGDYIALLKPRVMSLVVFSGMAGLLVAPGSIHPIVRIHEETGNETLYLGRREWAYIPGLPLIESEALLDELWSYAALAQNVWQQTWQPNDLIVWDNRRVLHRRDDFDNNARRLMKRCQVLARKADA